MGACWVRVWYSHIRLGVVFSKPELEVRDILSTFLFPFCPYRVFLLVVNSCTRPFCLRKSFSGRTNKKAMHLLNRQKLSK